MDTNENMTKNSASNGILTDFDTIISLFFRELLYVTENFSFPKMNYIRDNSSLFVAK